VVYFMTIVLLREYFDTSYINLFFIYKIMAIALIAWGPV
jgi:hypothetical protein